MGFEESIDHFNAGVKCRKGISPFAALTLYFAGSAFAARCGFADQLIQTLRKSPRSDRHGNYCEANQKIEV